MSEFKKVQKSQLKSILEKEKLSFWDLEIIFRFITTNLSYLKDGNVSDAQLAIK